MNLVLIKEVDCNIHNNPNVKFQLVRIISDVGKGIGNNTTTHFWYKCALSTPFLESNFAIYMED